MKYSPGRPRKPSAAPLAALLLLAACGRAPAASPVSLEAIAGFSGVLRAGRWAPLAFFDGVLDAGLPPVVRPLRLTTGTGKLAGLDCWREHGSTRGVAIERHYEVTRVLGLAFRAEKSRIVTRLDSNFMMAAIDLTGDTDARYILSVSEGVQKAVARAILHEESVENEPAEVLDDCVMEFVNVVCGNIAAKISQMGKEMNISTPMTIHPEAGGVPVSAGHTALCFLIYTGEGEKMELLLVIPG